MRRRYFITYALSCIGMLCTRSVASAKSFYGGFVRPFSQTPQKTDSKPLRVVSRLKLIKYPDYKIQTPEDFFGAIGLGPVDQLTDLINIYRANSVILHRDRYVNGKAELVIVTVWRSAEDYHTANRSIVAKRSLSEINKNVVISTTIG